MALLKSLARAGFYYGIAQLLMRGDVSRYQMQVAATRIATRVALAFAAIGLGFVAVLLLLATLFFYLAGMEEFIRPAVVTALVVGALALVLFWRSFAAPTRR